MEMIAPNNSLFGTEVYTPFGTSINTGTSDGFSLDDLYGSGDYSFDSGYGDMPAYDFSFGPSSGGDFSMSGMGDYGLDYGSGSMFNNDYSGDSSALAAFSPDMTNFDTSANESLDDWLRGQVYGASQALNTPAGKTATLLSQFTPAGQAVGLAKTGLNAFLDPGDTALRVGGNIAQTALLGPIGGLASMMGVNLPYMAYNAISNSSSGPTNQSQPNMSFADTAAGLGGIYSLYQGGKAAGQQANSLSNMYSNNSPYAKQLAQSLARKDAASGRRSQYGTREVELQAKLAAMANQVAPNIRNAQQDQYKQYGQLASLVGGLGKIWNQPSTTTPTVQTTPSLDLGSIWNNDNFSTPSLWD